jgi:hypothetical protein
MKIKKLANLRPVAMIALGVFLGRGAQADTILDFETIPADQILNAAPGILQTFGDYAAASSDGVTVVGFGTPNIGLTWNAGGAGDARWDYYNDLLTYNVWGGAGQLNDSLVGGFHSITFTPNSASARVVVKSFNFFPYYVSSERFTYNVSVLSGATVVSGPTNITFLSDATKNHPVNINYTGTPGQTLKLRLDRVASTLGAGEIEGGAFNIAVDDIKFAQQPETAFSSGPQVVSVTPADGQTGVAATYYPYLASITNGSTALVASSIILKLDGSLVSPPPTVSSADGLTNVSYPGTTLISSGAHTYTLLYADNLGASYTNEVQFIANYTTLPTTYALPPGAGLTNGFLYRTVSASTEATSLDSTLARAQAQLAGTLINTNTSLPYTNSATLGPNPDGSFNIDTVLNFNDNGTAAGNFPDDLPFPGLDSGLPSDWFSTEALLYLDLPAGYYRFGVNSDDGFEVNAAPPQGVLGSSIMLGSFDNGRGADNTLFDVLVQRSGIYPFQVIYFEDAGSASCEFFSVSDLATGDKVLINDPASSTAIKSYRVLKPLITNIIRSGPDVVINWAYGTPPFQVQFKSDLSSLLWTDSGSPTTNRTAHVPIQPGAGFIRVAGQ